MEFLIFTILTSWAICGLYLAAQEGMILYFITKFFDNNRDKTMIYPANFHYQLLHYLSNPIIKCPTCMASIWGGLAYWFYFGCLDLMTIFCIFILAFTNSVFIELYYKLRND